MKKFLLFFLLFFPVVVHAQLYYILDVSDNFSSVPSKPFPGDVVSLVAEIKNVGSSRTAFDVNARLSLNPQIFEELGVVQNVGGIKSNSSTQVAFSFMIKDSALPGSYTIPLELTYVNGSEIVTDYFDVNFTVNECFGLDVTDVSYLPQKVYAGEEIIVSAGVSNVCSGVARDVSLELVPVTNSSFDPFVLLSSNVLELGNILPGNSKNASFNLQPVSNASPGIYVFELKATCLDCDAGTSDKVSFEVLGRPWLIVSGTDFSITARKDSKDLRQGDVFSFSVQLDNIGKEKARAVKASIVVDDGVVGAKDSFVGNIDPDDSGSAIFDLAIIDGAKQGYHPVKIVIGYVDEAGLEKSVEADYTFFVNQKPAESPVFLVVLLIVLFVVIYFVLRLVFRQLSLRKAKLQ